MKKFHKAALLCALAIMAGQSTAQTRVVAADGGSRVDNWVSGDGSMVWRNGDGTQCWRDSNWTPATAAVGCDGALVAQAPAAEQAPMARAPAALPATAPGSVPTPPMASKATYAADAFFDFDKAVIKPAGKAALDDLMGKIAGVDVEVMIVVGHTDSVGSDAYNQKLSMRRAEAVRAYLVSKGVGSQRVMVEGRGESRPVADNATSAGRAQNRRVEIEVVGTRR